MPDPEPMRTPSTFFFFFFPHVWLWPLFHRSPSLAMVIAKMGKREGGKKARRMRRKKKVAEFPDKRGVTTGTCMHKMHIFTMPSFEPACILLEEQRVPVCRLLLHQLYFTQEREERGDEECNYFPRFPFRCLFPEKKKHTIFTD